MAVQDSPAYGSLQRNLDAFENNRFRLVMKGAYEVHSVFVIPDREGSTVAGQEVVDGAPEGSVFVSYQTSLAPYDVVREDGTIVQHEEGWANRSRMAIVSPTESGWKYFWVES